MLVPKAVSVLTLAAVIAWSKERMGLRKYLRIVEIVVAMPMTATGKFLKRAMRR